MGVVIESQTIVPHVMYGVACLLHGADGDGFNQVLLLLALDVIQQVVDGFGNVGLCATGAQLVAETGDELCQVVQLLRVGEVVNTVWQHFGFLAFGHTAYLFGYGTVGKQHELLYQLVGIFRLLEVDADGFALLVNFELHFVAVEVDGSCLKAVLTQYFGKLIQLEHLFLEVSFAGFDNLLGFFVGEAAVAFDDGMHYARVLHFSLFRHFEDDGIGQLLFVGAEGADEVAQSFGEHRDGAVYEVDGCGTLLGFLVYDAALFHVMGHVGDMYAHFPKSLFQFADGEGVVEVLGIFGVDGEGGYAPEVLASGYFLGGDFGGYLVSGFLYGGWIDIRQPEFREDGMHLGGVVSGASQDVDYLTDGVFGFVGPFHHLYDGFVARFAAFQFLFGDEDVVGKRTVFRYKESV